MLPRCRPSCFCGGKRLRGGSSESPDTDDEFWIQSLEHELMTALPGFSLWALDQTDIESLFDYLAYIAHKNGKENEKSIIIGGQRYKVVDRFSTPI